MRTSPPSPLLAVFRQAAPFLDMLDNGLDLLWVDSTRFHILPMSDARRQRLRCLQSRKARPHYGDRERAEKRAPVPRSA